MRGVDWLVLTAANAAQARGYEAQLRSRELRGAFPGNVPWRVVPDPGGRRIGSGGATLWVLYELAQAILRRTPSAGSIRALFEGKRIIVIHSGGDSRRLPAYAAQGKIFAPLPCRTGDGGPAALFDLIACGLRSLHAPKAGQVLIASGDVLLTFDPEAVNFDCRGVMGIAYPGSIERGGRHGVYVPDSQGNVVDLLQKPDEETARNRHAIDSAGRMMIDTGLISLDPQATEHWLLAAGVRLKNGDLLPGTGLLRDVRDHRCSAVDLYEHLLAALGPGIDDRAFGRLVNNPALSRIRKAFQKDPFKVTILPYCEFFHLGSSRELLANISTLNRTAKTHSFANFERASVADRASLEGAFVYNSVLRSPHISVGRSVLLESVHTERPVELQGSNVAVGWPRTARKALRLPDGWGVVCLPVRPAEGSAKGLWTVVVFGVDDDFKTPVQRGGTFGNRPVTEFQERHALEQTALWPDSGEQPNSLWNARLWTVGRLDAVLNATFWMCGARRRRNIGKWTGRKRYSMEQLLALVDHERLLACREETIRVADVHSLADRLRRNRFLAASDVLASIRTAQDAGSVQHQIARLLDGRGQELRDAHLYMLAHMVQSSHGVGLPGEPGAGSGDLEKKAFSSVARVVAREVVLPAEPRPAAILRDQVVWVTCPVRIDFAGGWSDTPPICAELGGVVLNAAVTLNGQYPVQAIAKLQDRPGLTLTSLDLGQRVEIASTPRPEEYRNPGDWSALPKAALVLGGACPSDPSIPLRKWLGRIGGGLDITLFSALPKGSGLGTSSILGAAMLACLARVLGEPVSREEIIARTSLLEQMMTTGGGWQDQIGGIEPGVKLIRTEPGPEQKPRIHRIAFDFSPGSALQSRVLLYYTGYTRMARNILQKVVGRYLAYDPEAISIIKELKDCAEAMESDLGAGDVDAFGRGIQRYWELKKSLDPGSTNPQIEALIRPLDRFLTGRLLPGAGGGGFLFMVARDAGAAVRIRRHLMQNPPNPLARFFDLEIDRKGLLVTIL
jgi:fucokinase